MDLASILALPSTLTVDRIERGVEGLVIFLHASTSTVSCPRCGTAGSRVHSRYTRTVADLTCVGQRLILKLLVRKWVCPLDSCLQRIFAEPFPRLVRRYARMTDRLINAFQSIGVTANGADGARLFAHLVHLPVEQSRETAESEAHLPVARSAPRSPLLVTRSGPS